VVDGPQANIKNQIKTRVLVHANIFIIFIVIRPQRIASNRLQHGRMNHLIYYNIDVG